ncbi:MAG: hypothetical protein Q7T53_05050 [Deltaproteobacteria bacterium]|nr:hypothetical protein [Deltaproteobacteria bacterium]
MGYNFIECNREQIHLLPPSLRDWLPEEQLSWFIIDAVNKVELGEFYRKHRPDGRGQAAFEPSMMLSLLLCAYSNGVRSNIFIPYQMWLYRKSEGRFPYF